MERIPMSKVDYLNELDTMVQLAIKKELDGFIKYGEGMSADFDAIKEIEEEIADTINYMVMGMVKIRRLLEKAKKVLV